MWLIRQTDQYIYLVNIEVVTIEIPRVILKLY